MVAIPIPTARPPEVAAERDVLWVDDDKRILSAARRILESHGYRVRTAGTAEEALTLIGERVPTLVVSDFSMPNMDGAQFLRRVGEIAPQSMRLLITARTEADVVVRAVNDGHIYRFMAKPVSTPDLLAALDAASQQYEARIGTDTRRLEHQLLQKKLDMAIDGLWMAYQPIVTTGDAHVHAYEALLRSDDKQLPHAGAILDAAEELASVQRLGRAVRESVAKTLQLQPFTAFVNLHANELMDDRLYDPQAPLSHFAKRVVLEITERVALQNVADLQERIAVLRRLGFRLAVDDLGAGYAGLNAIAALAPEIIKLDMALIRGIEADSTKQKLVRALSVLSRDLGAQVVAEGVETEAERQALLGLGCDFMQGYLFGKPTRTPWVR